VSRCELISGDAATRDRCWLTWQPIAHNVSRLRAVRITSVEKTRMSNFGVPTSVFSVQAKTFAQTFARLIQRELTLGDWR
jgi:hypothetical protein